MYGGLRGAVSLSLALVVYNNEELDKNVRDKVNFIVILIILRFYSSLHF